MAESEDRLYRFGLGPELVSELAAQAAEAESLGLPHGVSTFSRSGRPDAASALRTEAEKHFRVHKTGRNPYHYTIELPKPVTDEVTALFNELFGRTGTA